MVEEDDAWRIATAPNALIVPDDWFQDRYQAASLYYLDPTASILVPEPVFVPTEQVAAALVERLLDGPSRSLSDVTRSFVPPGLTLGLSVPVDDGGVASVTLEGDPGPLTPEAAKLMVYQFAWTLKQDERVTGFNITIGDQPVTLEGGSSSSASTSARSTRRSTCRPARCCSGCTTDCWSRGTRSAARSWTDRSVRRSTASRT